MSTMFYCRNRDRWRTVARLGTNNGIDYLEVAPSQSQLTLYFLNPLPGQSGGVPAGPVLDKGNVFIEGGERVRNIQVTKLTVTNPKKLIVDVDKPGDYTTYTLRIGVSETDRDTVLPGFDQQLSSIEFSFKINCQNDFDCKSACDCPPEVLEEPRIDYLAKDYSSFRRLMLDRLSMIMPGWRERTVADLQVATVELLAYSADHLSYYQDAVATEGYLHTARKRTSLARHARLLDYQVHDGCNARTWVHVAVSMGSKITIKKGTLLTSHGTANNCVVSSIDKVSFIQEWNPVVFETMHDIDLTGDHNIISFYTWQDSNCCLPKGSTRATLRDEEQKLSLNKGDVLIFEEQYGPETGFRVDADPTHRHAVRLKSVSQDKDDLMNIGILHIEWYEEDALPFSLCLTSAVENKGESTIPLTEKSVALGNIVLADHGLTRNNGAILPPYRDEVGFAPLLPEAHNTVAVQYNHAAQKLIAAKKALVQDPHEATPVIWLFDGIETWEARRDLLASDRFAPEFVAEREADGSTKIRFGNGVLGRKPLPGIAHRVTWRTGNGKSGNIGADRINKLEFNGIGILEVRNPMPAFGGRDAQAMEEIRQFAPRAFRTQERAVTASDFVEKTELHPDVQKAAAKFYWTGSWYTVFIIIDRREGRDIDDDFKADIRKHLERYRLAGYDLEIRPPRFVPLQLTLQVCVRKNYFRSNVKKNLLQVFAKQGLTNGKLGFFHPDRFTFGQPAYLSEIYKTAMEITGVDSVEIKEFRRWDKDPDGEIQQGYLRPSPLEIIRLDNDPNFPERGRLDLIMLGGI